MQITFGTLLLAIMILVIAGLAVIGGVIALIRQQVVVDKDTGNVVEVDIPLFGKIRSNYPSVVAVFFGLVMVWLVVSWLQVEVQKIPLIAKIGFQYIGEAPLATARKADIFLSAIPQRYRTSQSGVPTDEPVEMRLDIDSGEGYDVIVFAPLSMRENGTTERAVEFGAMTIENVDGERIATYEGELVLE
jgi:hypothetical protein